MNLTEPQAGSDLGALRTPRRSRRRAYRITGQKIFITWGEHDLAENIVHLVLARLPDAPAGGAASRSSSCRSSWSMPDGTLGARNDLRCVSLEHKLGIHGSPTCVMAFGDKGGAVGYLVGEANRGLEYMFTMMNHARLDVGLQGVAIAERAYQQARDFARTRVQGRRRRADAGRCRSSTIADVRRMLMTMRAQIEATRALAYFAAGPIDRARHHPTTRRAAAQRRWSIC